MKQKQTQKSWLSLTGVWQLLFEEDYIRLNQEQLRSFGLMVFLENAKMFTCISNTFFVFLLHRKIEESTGLGHINAYKEQLTTLAQDNSETLLALLLVNMAFNMIYKLLHHVDFKARRASGIDSMRYHFYLFQRTFTNLVMIFGTVVGCTAFINRDILAMTLASICIFIQLLFFRISTYLDQRNNFETADLYAHNSNSNVVTLEIVESCLCVLYPTLYFMGLDNQVLKSLLLVFHFAIFYLRLDLVILQMYYQNFTTLTTTVLMNCFDGSIMVMALAYNYLQMDLIDNNLLVVVIAECVFSSWALLNYLTYDRYQAFFLECEEINQNPNLLYKLFNSYYDALEAISKNASEDIELIVSSYRKTHIDKCQKIDCYCHKETTQFGFFRHFVFEEIEKFQDVFKSNTKAMLYLLNFKFSVYEFYPTVHNEIERLQKNSTELPFIESFMAKSLKRKIDSWLKVQEKKRGLLETELVIQLDEVIESISIQMALEISIKHRKWNLLSKKICRIEELSAISEEELKSYVKMESYKNQYLKKYERSVLFNTLFIFYYRNVAFRKNSDSIFENNIKEKCRSIKQEEVRKVQVFSKQIFDKRSCTLEVSLDKKSIGTIIGASKAIKYVFGHNHKKVMGYNFSTFLPSSLQSCYLNKLKTWVEKGGSLQEFKELRNSFYSYKNDHCFSALTYNKVLSKNDKILLLCTIFKKNQRDLILIDKNERLIGYGKKMQTIFQSKLLEKNINTMISDLEKALKSNSKCIGNLQCQVYSPQYRKELQQRMEQKVDENNSNYLRYLKQVEMEMPEYTGFRSIWFKFSTAIQYDEKIFVVNVDRLGEKTGTDCNGQATQGLEDEGFEGEHSIDSILNDQELKGDNEVNPQNQSPQDNSSMTSTSGQNSYGLSKILTLFNQNLLNPKKIEDSRLIQKTWCSIVICFILAGLIGSSLYLNTLSLKDNCENFVVKQEVQLAFNLLESVANSIYAMKKYYPDQEQIQKLKIQCLSDKQKLNMLVGDQFQKINLQISLKRGTERYSYLKNEVQWNFSNIHSLQIPNLVYFYQIEILSSQMMAEFQDDANPVEASRTQKFQQLYLLNLKKIAEMREQLIELSLIEKNTNATSNFMTYLAQICGFAIIAVIQVSFFINYQKYRFDQRERHVKAYQLIPNQIIQEIRLHFLNLNTKVNIHKKRLEDNLLEDGWIEKDEICLPADRIYGFNKNKFVTLTPFKDWVQAIILFILLNSAQIYITTTLYQFDQESDFFLNLSEKISSEKALMTQTYLQMMQYYYFDRKSISYDWIHKLLLQTEANEVPLLSSFTFEPHWITKASEDFRTEFNRLLIENVCDLNEPYFTAELIELCNEKIQLSEKGVIVFMNSFLRLLYSTLKDWEENLSAITDAENSANYFLEHSEFEEIDFVTTYHVETFKRLNLALIGSFQSGYTERLDICIIIYCLVCGLLTIRLFKGIIDAGQERKKLSYLYGQILLIPPQVLKQSNLIVDYIKKNIEFEEAR